MTSKKTLKLVLAALMGGLVCLATFIFQIPTPPFGYIHCGDGFVLVSGILLGPVYGGAAAGIGSLLADISGPCPVYAPGTFIIKALMAILAAFIYSHLKNKKIAIVFVGLTGCLMVSLGYFIYEGLVLQYGLAATASIPTNLIQGAFGMILSFILVPALSANPVVRNLNATNL